MDPAILQQQLEFLEFQLEDAKDREKKQKMMYESMISSLTDPNYISPAASTEIEKIQTVHRSELSELQGKLQSQSEELSSLQRSNEDQYNTIESLNASIEDMKIRLSEAEHKAKSSTALNFKIEELTEELDTAKQEHTEKQIQLEENAAKTIEELRMLYDKEKQRMQAKINELQSQVRPSITDELEALKKESDQYASSLEAIKNESLQVIHDLRQELKHASLQELNAKNNTTNTEQLSSCIKSTQQEVKRIRKLIDKFQKALASLEKNEDTLKDQLKDREKEISKLKMSIRLKASKDPRQELNSSMQQQLIDKDCEITALRKQVGNLKLEKGLIRKPPSSPRHGRSSSMFSNHDSSIIVAPKEPVSPASLVSKYQKMVESALSLECEICRALVPTDSFYEHVNRCPHDSCSTDRLADTQSFQNAQKELNEYKFNLDKMRNARDKALLDSELLLSQLKTAKVDLAVAQEIAAEKHMEQKTLIDTLTEAICMVATEKNLSEKVKRVLDELLASCMKSPRPQYSPR